MKTDVVEQSMSLYNEKSAEYFSRARTEIEPLLPQLRNEGMRALEIGCSEGHTLDWLKKMKYCDWVAGVDPYAKLHPSIVTIDEFHPVDIEKNWINFEPASLDLILCLDVLEHLVNPWEIVRKLDTILKPGGRFIISLPNIRNYHVVFDLAFNGNFQYSESGILDKTHLRFFTRKTAIQLVECAGATMIQVITNDSYRWQKRLLKKLGLEDLIARQYLILAIKPL